MNAALGVSFAAVPVKVVDRSAGVVLMEGVCLVEPVGFVS